MMFESTTENNFDRTLKGAVKAKATLYALCTTVL